MMQPGTEWLLIIGMRFLPFRPLIGLHSFISPGNTKESTIRLNAPLLQLVRISGMSGPCSGGKKPHNYRDTGALK